MALFMGEKATMTMSTTQLLAFVKKRAKERRGYRRARD